MAGGLGGPEHAIQELVHHRIPPIGFLEVGAMSAALEDDQLRAGNGARDLPLDDGRRDAIVAARQHEGGGRDRAQARGELDLGDRAPTVHSGSAPTITRYTSGLNPATPG